MNEVRVELPPEIDVEEAKMLLSIALYETGHLSLGQAARMAGYTKPTFMELLGKRGVPVIDYPPEDLIREMSL